jgi:hypothetical protein
MGFWQRELYPIRASRDKAAKSRSRSSAAGNEGQRPISLTPSLQIMKEFAVCAQYVFGDDILGQE